MDKIYKAALRVLVWLGPGDQYSLLVREWLERLEDWLRSRDDAERTLVEKEGYSPNIRMLVVRSLWVQQGADLKYALAARRFWGRRWFRTYCPIMKCLHLSC